MSNLEIFKILHDVGDLARDYEATISKMPVLKQMNWLRETLAKAEANKKQSEEEKRQLDKDIEKATTKIGKE